jgi:hypothetical protein
MQKPFTCIHAHSVCVLVRGYALKGPRCACTHAVIACTCMTILYRQKFLFVHVCPCMSLHVHMYARICVLCIHTHAHTRCLVFWPRNGSLVHMYTCKCEHACKRTCASMHLDTRSCINTMFVYARVTKLVKKWRVTAWEGAMHMCIHVHVHGIHTHTHTHTHTQMCIHITA